MDDRKHDIAVILVNYNSSIHTVNCVHSIFQYTATKLNYQIIVVDNNSRKEEFKKLSSLHKHKNITIFRSRINGGFSSGNMLGVQLADAHYYYFLNNDCLLLSDCLTYFHTFMEQQRSAGSCSGYMINGKGEFEFNFRYFPTLGLKLFGAGILKIFKSKAYPSKYKPFLENTPVDLVCGNSMFIRASAFERIGGFDTSYFLYYEEEDIGLRLHRAMYQAYIIPEAKYQHLENQSSTSKGIRYPFVKEFYLSQSYYFRKNHTYWYAKVIQVLYFLRLLRKFYKSYDYVKLAFFILFGAHPKHSMRYQQIIS